MKTGGLFGVSLLAVCLFAFSLATAQQVPPADVLKAAEEGLQPFLQKIAPDEINQYGFAPDDLVQNASLGSPFQVHTITPAAMAQYKPGATVSSLITPTRMWYFPVLVAGQARAILVVDWLENRWQAVSLGYAGLARELAAMGLKWNAAQGYKPVLVAVFQARQYLFTVPEKDAFNLTPLAPQQQKAGVAAAGDDYGALTSAADIVARLNPVVQKAVQEAR